MSFVRNTVSSFVIIFAFLLFAGASDAAAQQMVASDGTVFGTALDKGADLFKNVRNVIFLVGGFGLVALAFFAVFGKLKWTWFASLAVGLAILAAAGSIIDYATTDSGKGDLAGSGYLGDTLTGSGGRP